MYYYLCVYGIVSSVSRYMLQVDTKLYDNIK